MAKTAGFLQITRRQSYAVVSLKRDPVNSLNLEFWKQLLQTLESLEADPAVRGVIFQSGLARDVFTAGNDILELYAPKTSKQRYRRVADMDLLGSVLRGCPAGHALARRRPPPPSCPGSPQGVLGHAEPVPVPALCVAAGDRGGHPRRLPSGRLLPGHVLRLPSDDRERVHWAQR